MRYNGLPIMQVSTVPIDPSIVAGIVARFGIDLREPSIREMNMLVDALEAEAELRFIRMEFGVPGLPTDPIAIEAEAHALRELGVGNLYAPTEGIPGLKEEGSRFFRNFLDLDVPPDCCIPTVGAMEGCFAGLALAARLHPDRKTVLCLEPGFPVNKVQLHFLGLEYASIDFHDHRGDDLIRAIEERAARGDVCGLLWSSPNNPSWIVLQEDELRGIAEVCDRHDLLAIEDLAYFAMDLRQNYFEPGKPPYQPTVLRYTKRALCVISSSKIFSYAGQRIALLGMSPELMQTESDALEGSTGMRQVGRALIHRVLYPIAASVPQSPQHGLTAMLREANAGNRKVFSPALEYARRARTMKRLFLENGFHLVYDHDMGQPLADGFYFTVAHPAFRDGGDLLAVLLRYGISAITLRSTGSVRVEGLRACVSMVGDDRFAELEARLRQFALDYPAAG